MFIVIFLMACTVDSTKKIISQKNMNEKSKADVTFGASVNNGVCFNCN